MKPEKQKISAEDLLRKMPSLALAGDESTLELILYEVLKLLTSEIGADIGQINLLPKAGRVEKVCIIKDGVPWLKKGMDMHLFEPSRGFTGLAIKSGKSILVRDIWEKDSTRKNTNPFLKIVPDMNLKYIEEIKKPVASIMIFPIKKGKEIFCTIELGRYRHRNMFTRTEKELVDDFAKSYGSLIMDYIVDIRNRLAINTAHQKLLAIARLIATNRKVDYREAVEAYRVLSSADIGMAFFKISGFHSSGLRLIPWHGEEIRELFFPEFIPSPDSILRDDIGLVFPLKGGQRDRRICRFYRRIEAFSGLREEDRAFTLRCLEDIKSYVVYPLHILSQDLGAVLLGSHRPKFWEFLQMNPFLSLYHSLLKSFLLNERMAHLLSDLSLRIHNPGFYCLAGLKGNLVQKYPVAFADPEITKSIETLQKLMDELHEKGKMIKCRKKDMYLLPWLESFVQSKRSLYPSIETELEIKGNLSPDCVISANEEYLETIFENLYVNSIRAINTRRKKDPSVVGHIGIAVQKKQEKIRVIFQDNGAPYKTVSGRGMPRVRSIIQDLGGNMRQYHNPFRIYLTFPYAVKVRKRRIYNEYNESKNSVF